MTRYNDGSTWTQNRQGLVIEYVAGFTQVPRDIARAGLIRLRSILAAERSAIPDRAVSFVAAEGGTYTLATPGRSGSQTGIPDVDGVLKRYSYRIPGIA